jgi:hypothetical protein
VQIEGAFVDVGFLAELKHGNPARLLFNKQIHQRVEDCGSGSVNSPVHSIALSF